MAQIESTQPLTTTRGRLDAITIMLATATWALLAAFAWLFQPGEPQWWVDGLWLGAVVVWVVVVRRLVSPPALLPAWPRPRAALLPGALLLLFAACWLPFYDNWRWAYTGDSIAWFQTAAGTVTDGFHQNLLSVHGVDANFTYLHSLAFNALLFVFGPTLFWHRVGKLIVSCLSLAAIYTYFTMTIGRRWALAVLTCVATNYVWLWFSYISYGHMDTYIFYFLTLALATVIWRHPDHLGAWMMCGLVGGLSVFFTQTSWSAVAVVGLVLGVYALATRRLSAIAIYAVTFLVVASPILIQFPGLLDMTTRQARSIYEWNYLLRIFTLILRFPYDSGYHNIGVNHAVLRWPLGEMYFAGAGVAAVGIIGPLRRRLRIPAIAPLLLGLLLWDAVLMTLTNNGYGLPSTKRAFSLIPLQVFLALLPAFVAYAWVERWRWPRRVVGLLLVGAIGMYISRNVLLLVYPEPGIYGVNAYDGLIELRQRFPDKQVLFLTTRDWYTQPLQEGGFFDRAYHLLDTVHLAAEVDEAAVQRACKRHLLLCYEPNSDREGFQPLLERNRERLKPFPLLNSVELACYQCLPAPARPGPSQG